MTDKRVRKRKEKGKRWWVLGVGKRKGVPSQNAKGYRQSRRLCTEMSVGFVLIVLCFFRFLFPRNARLNIPFLISAKGKFCVLTCSACLLLLAAWKELWCRHLATNACITILFFLLPRLTATSSFECPLESDGTGEGPKISSRISSRTVSHTNEASHHNFSRWCAVSLASCVNFREH